MERERMRKKNLGATKSVKGKKKRRGALIGEKNVMVFFINSPPFAASAPWWPVSEPAGWAFYPIDCECGSATPAALSVAEP